MPTSRGWLLAGCVILLFSVPAAAQRGGGGGGRGGGGAVSPPTRSSYENDDYGIAFRVPGGMGLYTPDQPGMYRRLLTDRRIAYLVRFDRPEESIGIKSADNMTEADVTSYQKIVDANPPQAGLPGFRKVALFESQIGKNGDKKAVSFIYEMTTAKTENAPSMEMTIRQVVFVHKGRGFTITCDASSKRFDKVNKDTFDKFLSQIEFR